jgi:hypothetical protein
MTAVRYNNEAKLRLLLADGAIARTACSVSFLKLLQPLLKAEVLTEERASGGRRLVVRDPDTLRDFVRRQFPDAPTGEDAMSRTIGIARFRDSKALASDTPEIVLVRAWRDNALDQGGQVIDVVNATAQHGVFSFLLGPDCRYFLRGPCALVENPAVFACFERLGLDVGLVIHGRGRASQRLIDWLSKQPAPDFSLLHLPDYDPVGMEEFERLHLHLRARVRLHIPPDLETRFTKFANRSLLDKERSRGILFRLRGSGSADVQQVVALIDRHNAGLEQEALLL